jgi:hypothetical protein
MMSKYLFNIDKIIILVVSLVYNSLQHNHIPLFYLLNNHPKIAKNKTTQKITPKKLSPNNTLLSQLHLPQSGLNSS